MIKTLSKSRFKLALECNTKAYYDANRDIYANQSSTNEFLNLLKTTFHCGIIRHTKLLNKKINRVAFCGGSGSFLLKKAISQKADVFITADFKYHEFFDAENQIMIADIGHIESEQFTSKIIADKLNEKFTNFAIRLTEINTNPINYF